MTAYSFIVPGVPVPMPRARMTRRGRVFTPKEAVAYKNLVGGYARSAGVKIQEGPLAMGFEFHIPRERPWVRGTGDLDNYIKTIQDALEGIAFINDSQVVGYLLPTGKFFDAEHPRACIRIQVAL